MLQFFKKAGHKTKAKFSHSSQTSHHPSPDEFKSASLVSIPNTICSFEEEEKEFEREKKNVQSFKSRLSKTLSEILSEKSAIGYFMQFMDSKKEMALIKFWLEVECLCCVYRNQRKLSKDLENFTDKVDNSACSLVSNNSVDDYIELGVLLLDNSVNNNDQSLVSNHNFLKIYCDNDERNCKLKESSLHQDVLFIFNKYLNKDEFGANRLTKELKDDAEKAVASENVELMINCLSKIQIVVYKILEREYFGDFLKSNFYCKYQIDVLTSGDVLLSDILYNETAFFYLMEFMEIENKRELLDFWMAALNFKKILLEKVNSSDPTEAQADALVIYNKYFSLQATTPLGFTDKIRFQVEQNICREDEKGPQSDCFDKPCQIVYNYLNKYYFSNFLQSQLFYNYLSELINSVQTNQYSSFHPIVRRAESDCSSEVSSFSNANVENQNNSVEKKQLKYTSSSVNGGMSIDTKQLYDPDSLWKRNKSSLSVGYVDNLGRFVTEIDPDPWHKSEKESRLSRAVKRLVHIEQDKAKEESAWKIAEMIVRDVTSLTLGNSDLPN